MYPEVQMKKITIIFFLLENKTPFIKLKSHA